MYKNIHPCPYTSCIALHYAGFLATDQLHHSPDVILAYTTSSILLYPGGQYSPRLFFLVPFFFPWLVAVTAENQRQPHTFVSVFHFVLLQKLKRKALERLSSAQVRKQLFTMKKAQKFVLPELGNSCHCHHYGFFRHFLWPGS